MDISSFDWIAKAKQSQRRLDKLMADAAKRYSNAKSTGCAGSQFEIAVAQCLAANGISDSRVAPSGKVDKIVYLTGDDGKKHRFRIEVKSGSGIVAQLKPRLGLRTISEFSEADILPDAEVIVYAARPEEFETLDDLLDNTVVLIRTEFITMVSNAGGKKKSGFETCFSVQCNNSALIAKNKELPAMVEIEDEHGDKVLGPDGKPVRVPTTREIVDKKTGEKRLTRRGCPRWTDCIVMQTSYLDARAEAVELGLETGEMVSFRSWLEENGRA